MSKSISLKYWFVHGDNTGNIYEDEKGNWIVVFNGVVKVGESFYVHDKDGNVVSAEEIGLLDILRSFIVEKLDWDK